MDLWVQVKTTLKFATNTLVYGEICPDNPHIFRGKYLIHCEKMGKKNQGINIKGILFITNAGKIL